MLSRKNTKQQGAKCQKCGEVGHWTYQCKQPAQVYLSRPTATQLLKNPELRKKLSDDEDTKPPPINEYRAKLEKLLKKQKKKEKRRKRRRRR